MGKSKSRSSKKYFDPRDFFPHLETVGRPELMPKYPTTLSELADEQIKAVNPNYWMHMGFAFTNTSVAAPWMWYGMMLGTMEAMRDSAQSSKKIEKHHKEAVKAVRKFAKQVAGSEAVIPPQVDKDAKKATKKKSKSSQKAKPEAKAKADQKSKSGAKSKPEVKSKSAGKPGGGKKGKIEVPNAIPAKTVPAGSTTNAKAAPNDKSGVKPPVAPVSALLKSDTASAGNKADVGIAKKPELATASVIDKKRARPGNGKADISVENLSTPLMNVGSVKAKEKPKVESAQPVGLLKMVSEPTGEASDDLKLISGVGPKLEKTLNGLGVYNFSQIAEWTASEIDWVEEYLQFPGRIERDNWIGQAKALAKGGRDEYVKVFGKEPR